MPKLATIKIRLHDDTKQNEVKDWLKTIPTHISKQGEQTITWENVPHTEAELAEIKAAEDAAKAAEVKVA